MLDKIDGPWKIALTVLMFPLLFQEQFLSFAWGGDDIWQIALAKRVFVLMPIAAIVFGCWATIACLLTVPFRHKRAVFVQAMFVTWWDLARAIFAFWGGSFKFVFYLLGWIFGFFRLLVLGLWLLIQDILLTPLRMVKNVGEGYFQPGVPWIAVIMTLAWGILEAVIFTFMLTPLVFDVLSGMVEGRMNQSVIQFVLFFMLLAFVLGSYAVLANLAIAIKKRDVPTIVQIVAFEIFVLVFEVIFLYREFVAAIIPWFRQYSGGELNIGMFGIIFIGFFIWMGIRGMTWFLFAKAGTPTIMAIIERTGLQSGRKEKGEKLSLVYVNTAIDRIKKDINWIHEKGDEMLSAFLVPPLQIAAGVINFCTLFISARHLFELPFESFKEILEAQELMKKVKEKDKE